MIDGKDRDLMSSTPWLVGGGEMGKLIREMDWSTTPLGAIETWPQSLRTAVGICLASDFPINIIWGPQRTQIYNDGYRPLTGAKHPRSMGQDYKECRASAWSSLKDPFENAMAGNTDLLVDEQLFLDRYGYLEEAYFTFSLSPIRDELGEVGGLFLPVTETTQQTLAERRLKVLRELADHSSEAKSVEAACTSIARTLEGHALDVPFALLYLLDADGRRATLAGQAGLEPGVAAAPATVDLDEKQPSPWPFARAARTLQVVEVDGLEARFGPLACGPYPESPAAALILPIAVSDLPHPLGLLVVGASARRALDEPYRTFFLMLRESATAALTNARVYEEEHRRSEALAELDRAKTAFFSNVGHEFRTPLSLILGPLEDLLSNSGVVLEPDAQGQLEVVYRNSLRLLRLVNTMLDVSRIEAGRIQASFEPVDLAAYTAELASVFRSAIERAGMQLIVACPPLPEPVYIDRDMWEKVVLNLLSNAFKYTLEGHIEVRLEAGDGHARLTVRDTGVGIPADELPRLFQRFHRVKDARGRTHEGTGIGLALVQELARLHGGSVHAESILHEGSTFTVTLPLGTAHLDPERIETGGDLAPTNGAHAFVEEALRWLPETAPVPEGVPSEVPDQSLLVRGLGLDASVASDVQGARILLADGNADMREYVHRLLETQFDVESVADGMAALEAARLNPPELVLSDVMMPRLDGPGLLDAFRADPQFRYVPIILLSARSGEEARIAGMQSGADDYLVKPFNARELVARVESHVRLARLRSKADTALRDSEERFRLLVSASAYVVYRMSPDWRIMYELQGKEFIAPLDSPSEAWLEHYIHPEDMPRVVAAIEKAVRSKSMFELEHRVRRADGTTGWALSRAVPLLDEGGEIIEWFGAATDVTARKVAEAALRRNLRRQAFLLSLNDVLRTLQSPEDVQFTAARLLCKHLGANRVGYAEGWGDDATGAVALTYSDGVADFEGAYPSSDFGVKRYEMFRAGRTVVFPDIANDPTLTGAERKSHAHFEIGASITVPLLKEGALVALFFAHQKQARPWTTEEVVLLEAVAERTWEAVERARAEAILRQNEARQAFILGLSDTIRTLTSPDEIERTVTGRLRDHLGADRAYYLSFPEQAALQKPQDAANGKAPTGTGGRDRVGPFPWPMDAAQLGHPFIVHDVSEDDRFDAQDRQHIRDLAFSAFILVPVAVAGRLIGALSVISRAPRRWAGEEIALVEATVERTWTAVERARAEEAIRESEARYRTLFTTIDEGFCVVEVLFDDGTPVDYRFLEANPAFEKQTGLIDAVGKRMRELEPNLEEHWFTTYGRIARTGVPERFTAEARALNRWYDVYAFRIGEPQERKVAILFNDVSEHRKAAQALRESEEQFRTVAELVPDLLWRSKANGSSVWYNQRWFEYTGQTLEASAGWGWVETIHPDDRLASRSNYERAMAAGRLFEQEHRIRRADGAYRWFLVRAEPVRDKGGQVQHWFGSATDIHEQRTALDLLEQRVEARTRQVRALASRLTMAEQEERHRISQILHDDLQQLLYGIEMKMSLVRKDLLDSPQPRLETDLEEARAWVGDAITTTRRLTVDLSPPILHNEGLADALKWLQRQMKELHGLEIIVEAEHAFCLEDEDLHVLLFQIVRELLFNVKKHSGSNRATVRLVQAADHLVIDVIDEGDGFDAEALDELGTGLRGFGLFSVRERLGLLGGHVEVRSRPGQGTHVVLRTPMTSSRSRS